MTDSDTNTAKGCFIAAALAFGLAVFILTSCEIDRPTGGYLLPTLTLQPNWMLRGPLFGIAASLAYPFLAAPAIRILAAVRHWAYGGAKKPLSRAAKIFLAAFWPVTLLPSLVGYLILGLIERLFAE